jgi:hypothetical protein
MLVICTVVFVSSHVYAGPRITGLQIGPSWPEDVDGLAWMAGLESGMVFDDIIHLGGGANLLWRSESKDTLDENTTSGVSKRVDTLRIRRYMFPVYAYIGVDPVPELIVHPVLTVDVGLNMMFYSKDTLDPVEGKLVKADAANGLYIGPLVRLGLEGVYDIGDAVSAYVGCAYAWSRMTKSADGGKYERPMNAFDMHLGLRFAL